MTENLKEKCHYIIHSHAAAAGGRKVVRALFNDFVKMERGRRAV